MGILCMGSYGRYRVYWVNTLPYFSLVVMGTRRAKGPTSNQSANTTAQRGVVERKDQPIS